ncbi:AcrR family transcriptional regulator [Desulfoluna limicola]|uniref:AcrR family transcriptional regulator n=1 Tax=Desulfoluna limicola TaxID=2810562 RepID=A0ABM7PHG2_9BACT|nr:TetR/AcrR family transcriptional regulator [Desulfoluna limicola]BCS96531.1 AcrR family transcriptional regulator [Desulfoluna limicola]
METINRGVSKASGVRIPKQKRGIVMRQKLMDAAVELFSEKGIHKTTSKDIASRAGVSIGSFYAYFTDKRALLLEALESYLDNHFDCIWNNPNLRFDAFTRKNIRDVFANLFAAYRVAPGFHRETHVLRYSDPDVRALYDRDVARQLRHIKLVFAMFQESLTIWDRDAAALVIHSAAENIAHKAVLFGRDSDEERVLDEFSVMVFHYLTSEPNPRAVGC